MANLFDIGKSGLESYRQALSVTGQNIANIETDGYKRREASLEEISGGKGGVTSIGKETGLGVRVTSIRRSFDEFLLNKARSANASAISKETFYQNVKNLEDILLPGESNIGTQLNRFFSGLQEISATPSDMAARAVALEQGRSLANSFQELAVLARNTSSDLERFAKQEVSDLNIFTTELSNLNQRIAAMGSSASNSILDSRDALIDKITRVVGVTVELTAAGAAKLTLGSTGQGPAIVDGINQSNLSLDNVDGRLSFSVARGASRVLTSQVTSGSLHGIGDAYLTSDEVMKEIDNLAFVLVRDMNALHKQGIDLDGEQGGLVFRALDVNLKANPTNFGDCVAEPQIIDHGALSTEKITFTYDAERQVWNGRTDNGSLVASGRSSVNLPGLKVQFFGEPVNLDQIILDPISGSASGVNFALSRGEDFAAASPVLVSADVSNVGDAVLSMAPTSASSPSGLASIAEFHNGLSAISSSQFVQGGAVAVIPANVSSIDLLSLSRQSSSQFNVADTEMAGVVSMSLDIKSVDNSGNPVSKTVNFNLSPSSFKDGSAGWSDMKEIASLLNQGAITGTVSGTGQTVTFAGLGAYASGFEENMTISLSSDDFSAASLGLGSGKVSNAALLARIDAASDIQILTREGRHIAGTVAASNSTEKWRTQIDNSPPFIKGAVYRSDYLNLSGDQGYIGVKVDSTFNATDALVETSDNSVLKLSELATPAAGEFNAVKLSTTDGNVVEFGARAAASADGNSVKALKAAFDDLADKKGFSVSLDALNNLHFARSDGLDFSVQKSTSTYKAVFVSGHSTINDGASRTLALRTPDAKVVLQGTSNSNVESTVLGDLASQFRALDEVGRQGFNLAEITDSSGNTVSLQFYRVDGSDFTIQSTSDDLVHDGGSNAASAQFTPTIAAEVNIANKAGGNGLETGDVVSVALTNGDKSISANEITVTSAGVVKDVYDYFTAQSPKKGYSFSINGSNSQLTVKRADGVNFSVRVTPQDRSGDGVDVMQLDLDGGGNNISTDTTGAYQFTTGGNSTVAMVNIAGVTTIADNLVENVTVGGGLLSTSAVTTNSASKVNGNQNATAVKFGSLEGIDTNESSHDGFSASAQTVNYKVMVGNLNVTLGSAEIDGSRGDDVARAAIEALRAGAPIPTITGLVSKKSAISFTLSDVSLSASQIHSDVKKVVNYQGANYTFISDGSNISVSGGPANVMSLDFSGSTVSGFAKSPPKDGETVYIAFEDQQYALTMKDGEVVVSGGEQDRLTAFFDSEMKLRISAQTGSLSKSAFSIVPDTTIFGNVEAARNFGLMDGFTTPVTYFSNQPWIGVNFKSGGNAAEGNETIQVDLVGASGTENLSFTSGALASNDDDEILTKIKTAFDALVDKKGYTASVSDNVLWFTRFDGGNFSFEATEGGTVGSTAISLEASLWPAAKADLSSGVPTSATSIGSSYKATDFELSLEGDKITAKSAGDVLAPTFIVEAQSLAGQRLTLTDLPDEELIIAIGDVGARRISMQYDLVPENTPKIAQDIKVKILDANAGTVEFFDKATGTSIASRTLDDDNSTEALSFEDELEGILKSGDSFFMESNLSGVGDSRAMQELISLRSAEDRADGRGGFQRLFSNTVSKLGATVQSGKMSAEASASIRDASAEAEASYTGVNLDAEASSLIQQQQAYQASARILQTAREIFDTLLQSI